MRLERYHLVAIAGWISKIIAIVFSLVNTRLLIELVGVRGFAIYAILFSMIGWLSLLNLGIPNATQNLISKYRIKGSNLRDIFESIVFIILCIIAIGLVVIPILSLIVYKFILINYQGLICFKTVVFALLCLYRMLPSPSHGGQQLVPIKKVCHMGGPEPGN